MASSHIATKQVATVDKDDEDLVYESNTALSAYSYRSSPLKRPRDIRVLTLHAGEPYTRLSCSLTVHGLDDVDLQYNAVSYTWMSSEFDQLYVALERVPITDEVHEKTSIRHPIWCDGRRILVSTNLRDFLRQARSQICCRIFWIDAICINQNDFEERASQVLLMRDIYQKSFTSVLWLGAADEHSENAFAMAERIANNPSIDLFSNDLDIPMAQIDYTDRSGEQRFGLPPPNSPEWDDFVRLFERPVFRRLWVIQEVVLSRSTLAICGPYALPFDQLARTLSFLGSCGWMEVISRATSKNQLYFISAMSNLRRIYQMYGMLRMSEILETNAFSTTDPRDKIYGLLGMTNLGQSENPLLLPDYTKSVESVYTEATLCFLKIEGNLDSLSRRECQPERRNCKLPSWVPDYADESTKYSPLLDHNPRVMCCYRASGNSQLREISATQQHSILQIQAFHIDVVKSCAQRDPVDIGAEEIGELLDMIETIPSHYRATNENVLDALWRTIFGNIDPKSKEYPAPKELGVLFYRLQVHKFALAMGAPPQDVHGDQSYRRALIQDSNMCAAAWVESMFKMRFYLTRAGLMGMGPTAILPGDSVYVVAGARVPFVLRKGNGNVHTHRFIGDCYLHGMMMGEALSLDGFKWSNLELE